jgi:GNAT superfamily N-acetyltransferase
MAKYKIIEVNSTADLDDFINVPFEIYKNNPYWVPLPVSESRKFFDKKSNAFFLHSDAKFYIAKQDGKPIARIAAILNNRHNQFNNEKTGFFGFFECPEDQGLAGELFDLAADYAKAAGMDTLRGPANYSSNDDWGWLTNNYDSMPVFQMPYNQPYYLKLAENHGFVKARDLLAYYLDDSKGFPEKFIRVAERIRKKHSIEVRKLNMKRFDDELRIVRDVYNAAWSQNWGFVPMTEEEIEHVAGDFKQIVDPEVVLFAFVNGKPAGFSLAMPDLNPVFRKMYGKLFPTGIFKFLWHTKIKPSATGIRLMALGVVPEYQKLGIDSVFYVDTYNNGTAKGYSWVEMSWVLEDNAMMTRAAEMMGARPYKRYRLYDKKL